MMTGWMYCYGPFKGILTDLTYCYGLFKGMLDDDAESDEGAAGAANVRTVLSQKRALMGEQTADIVIGALQKVRAHRRSLHVCIATGKSTTMVS